MSKSVIIAILVFLILVGLVSLNFAENLTLTTYYPAPYGNYTELRASRMALGDTYKNSASYRWPTEVDTDADLVIEGNVGIGTTNPAHKLDIVGAMYSQRYALTDGEPIAVDWDNGNVQSVTIGGNRTFTFSNGQDGGKYLLIIKQGGAGSWEPVWPASVRWPGASTPALTDTAGRTDYIGFIYNGVDSKYDGVAQALDFQ
ncbi:MAG: hypothetical protein V1893_02555 [Candidatus Omnitrophota bacterium]